MTWYKQHRLEWIAETLRVFGYIMRQHLERKFNISTPQASLDFQDFMREYPGRMVYDKNAKMYASTAPEFAKVMKP